MKNDAHMKVSQDPYFNRPLAAFGYVNQLVQKEITAALKDDERREATYPVEQDRRVAA